MLGISQEWLCGHQEIVSVFMVIGSVVGVVVGLGAIGAPIWLWDETKKKLIYKYEDRARRVYDFIWDKWLLMWVGVGLFAILCGIFLPGWTWKDLKDVVIAVIAFILSIAILLLFAWATGSAVEKVGKPIDKMLSYDTKAKIKRWKERVGLAVVGSVMLGAVGACLWELYKWWVLQICG